MFFVEHEFFDGFSSVDGAAIYIGGSVDRQKSFRGLEV